MRFGFIAVLLLVSCATAHVETYDKKTGAKDCEANYSSLFKDVEGIKMQACHAKGEASMSKADVEAIKVAVGTLMNVLATVPK